jgi:hypothetical protein
MGNFMGVIHGARKGGKHIFWAILIICGFSLKRVETFHNRRLFYASNFFPFFSKKTLCIAFKEAVKTTDKLKNWFD